MHFVLLRAEKKIKLVTLSTSKSSVDVPKNDLQV